MDGGLISSLLKSQLMMKKRIVLEDSFDKLTTVGGVDQAFLNDKIISSIVVCDFKTLRVVEKVSSISTAKFPYIPGFLSFREGPTIVKAFKKLKTKPDVLLVDGNGILHPRFIGLASHVGVVLDIPTVGVAKSLLTGIVKNCIVYIDNKPVGFQLYTKKGCNPIYVSPGHRVSLETSLEIVKRCLKGHKLPEPLRLAHLEANRTKRLLE
ncbi:MAG: endonuclease V [Candidatus Aenigmarchaeota archaeon]|nr:endonuclease V [Candidatus Aenigmarchaeota archaeon]